MRAARHDAPHGGRRHGALECADRQGEIPVGQNPGDPAMTIENDHRAGPRAGHALAGERQCRVHGAQLRWPGHQVLDPEGPRARERCGAGAGAAGVASATLRGTLTTVRTVVGVMTGSLEVCQLQCKGEAYPSRVHLLVALWAAPY